jgi:hypothetical protein
MGGNSPDRLAPPTGVRLLLEPGRWLAADCSWYAAEVVDVDGNEGRTLRSGPVDPSSPKRHLTRSINYDKFLTSTCPTAIVR